jgi:hypothetical protein
VFLLEGRTGKWICWDFKGFRVEPTHYRLRASYSYPLKSWAVDGSEDRASWTEIDRRENDSDINDHLAVKTFEVAESESFSAIRLRQTGPNHYSGNCLVLSAFEAFGVLARPQ